MKEAIFVKQNISQWQQTELLLDGAEAESPDVLANAYISTTSDLAFAQTHYPQSRITTYLNNLASALHNEIYRNKRERWSRLLTFWTQEMPQTIWEARKELLLSATIFVVSVLVGVVSQWLDPDFSRLIMGNSYVEMTLDNIENGEPMGVYGNTPEGLMFGMITLNNIYVSFLVFVMGLFTSFATGFQLFRNGVMLGAFQMFFAQHHLLWESALTVWLHGTIEISSIVVAGAAGIAMGNGWLFPGTYSRLYSFRRGAMRGLKIVIGTVPLFCMAGFIESFLTRHTEFSDAVKLSIILLSAAFIVYYYIVLPYLRNHNHATESAKD
jgi:uncharacterized membrane protein SpoIIM required for sporulation